LQLKILERSLSVDNTTNIIFGILAVIIGMLSIAIAWVTLRDQRNRYRRRYVDDIELGRILGDAVSSGFPR